jgi:hypothetical protein
MVWSPFGLPHEFSLIVDFCCLLNGIKVLDIPFGFVFSISSFYKTCWMKMFVM